MDPRDNLTRIASAAQQLLASSRKNRIISASALFLTVCAFGAAGVAPLAPDASDLPVRSVSQELTMPDLGKQPGSNPTPAQLYESETSINSGDTLATLLTRLGVDDNAAANFIKRDKVAHDALQLTPGRHVQAQTDEEHNLKWLRTTVMDRNDKNAAVKNLIVSRVGDHFTATESTAKLERRIEMRSGVIKSGSGLFRATDDAEIPGYVAGQIVEIFKTDIDFNTDLQRGDRFNIVYETFWQDGEFVRAGRILAGEFHNSGKTYQTVWFEDPVTKQGGGYYGFDGKSLKKAFLKSPLEYTRISSGFSMRIHPISGQWKQHKGIDFAAATGTPILATADGEVDFIGGQNGYGNVVVLKHWSNYSTAYAHMSRFAGGLHKGSKISQGQVIGYVGATGWATGPHLHYEFRVNKEARDPLSINMPNAQPLAGAELQKFKQVASEMTHYIDLLAWRDTTQVASR